MEEFHNECDKIHTALNKRILRNKLLYHYTSFEALKHILKKRRLRYTDYRHVNDPTEIEYGIQLILDLFKETFDNHTYSSANLFFNDLINESRFYISCLSSVNTMALWRYYGLNGKGVCIGFNRNYFKPDNNSEFSPYEGIICPVIYGKKNAIQIISKYIQVFNDYFSSSPLNNIRLLISHMVAILLMFKDKSFKDEKEIRMYCMEGPILIIKDKPFYYDASYREKILALHEENNYIKKSFDKEMIIPHEFKHTDISEIWVGSACDFQTASEHIKKLLEENNFDLSNIKILQSKHPIR